MTDKFINVNCESCGADLAIPQGEASMKCGFCGTLNKPTFDDSGAAANPSRNLMLNAVESENWEEVTKYSTTILEEDPSDHEAWFYKGAAAGWVSRHIDDPSKEIINCFRNAFANSKEEDTEDVLNLFGSKGSELLDALAGGSRAFAQEHGYLAVGDISDGWEQDIMNGHVSKVLGFIEASYILTEINRNDRVEKLNPAIDAKFLNLYSFLHTKIPFNGTLTNKNPFNITAMTFQFVYDPSSESGLKWESRVDEIIETHTNGGYDAESMESNNLSENNFTNPREGGSDESSSGGCFVATAVYGGEDHFNLIVLRSFRDNFLKNYYLGRIFITFYYKHGPKLAKKVVDSKLLKSLFTPLVELGVFIVKLFRLG